MAAEMHPFSSVLSYSDDDSSYTPLTLIRLIKPPNITRGSMEVTNLASTEGWREYLQGWKDAGQMRFEIYLAKALVSTLISTGEAFFGNSPGDTNKWWKVTFPLVAAEATASLVKCMGHLVEGDFSEIRAASDEALMFACAIKLTGKPVFTAGT